MLIANMSKFAFVNRLGINFPCLVEDVNGNLVYEHTLIPFVGFNESDFNEIHGLTILTSHCYPVLKENTLMLKKASRHDKTDNKVIFLYSFPIITGGEFGVFPETVQPESAFKFRSGNPDSGYYFEMIFILDRDIKYEILYHSMLNNQVIAFDFLWNSALDSVITKPRMIM